MRVRLSVVSTLRGRHNGSQKEAVDYGHTVRRESLPHMKIYQLIQLRFNNGFINNETAYPTQATIIMVAPEVIS